VLPGADAPSALARNWPTLLDVQVDPGAVPPVIAEQSTPDDSLSIRLCGRLNLGPRHLQRLRLSE